MEALLARFADLPSWQIALAASWLLLQGSVLPSVPEEVVVATLGMLWGQGRVGFAMALAAVLAGLLPANSAAVFVGSRLSHGLSGWGPFSRAFRSEAVQGALGAVRRHGRGLVFVTRFTPLVRGPVYLAAGLSQMGVRRFFLVDAAAACIHAPLLLWLGARVGRGAGSIAEAWSRAGFLAGGLAAVAIAYQIVLRLRRGAVNGARPALGTRTESPSP
jgi:membrane protein DedA with SNARE-associated domain